MGKFLLCVFLLLGLDTSACALGVPSTATGAPASAAPTPEVAGASAAGTPATPVPRRTQTFGAQPTPTIIAPPTFTPAPSPTAIREPLPALNTLSPDSTVRMFYNLLAQRRYADLRQLVTGAVYASLPDPKTLDERTPAGDLTVERAEVTDRDPSGNRATVTVEVVEQASSRTQVAHRYAGTWTLVRGPSGWLLEASDLHVE